MGAWKGVVSVSLEQWRDVIVIAAGSLLILLLLAAFVFTVVLGLATRLLLGTVRSLLRDEVTPLVRSVRQTVTRVQGTVTFVSDTVVKPVIRVYAIVAGARRAAGVLSGMSGRRNQRK
jgi:hypothetical protein